MTEALLAYRKEQADKVVADSEKVVQDAGC